MVVFETVKLRISFFIKNGSGLPGFSLSQSYAEVMWFSRYHITHLILRLFDQSQYLNTTKFRRNSPVKILVYSPLTIMENTFRRFNLSSPEDYSDGKHMSIALFYLPCCDDSCALFGIMAVLCKLTLRILSPVLPARRAAEPLKCLSTFSIGSSLFVYPYTYRYSAEFSPRIDIIYIILHSTKIVQKYFYTYTFFNSLSHESKKSLINSISISNSLLT